MLPLGTKVKELVMLLAEIDSNRTVEMVMTTMIRELVAEEHSELPESDEVEKYVSGLPNMIHGSLMAFKPKTRQEAIEFVTELMDQKICTLADCQAENKRKF
ncbi:hypothetical protein Tco_1092781 [Tanacetum coccineum]|uniref:Uncharacterized protein n=1 Tax=Tanacetum coccineum TaxID=301880 RepID=A0ABQ5IAU4_9ASTR